MTGKHDKKADEDQSANLLLTGPIAIRGLGRGVKDALLPGRPSRHRAFAAGGGEIDDATTAEDATAEEESGSVGPVLDDGQEATESGPSMGSEQPDTQIDVVEQSVLQDDAVVRTDTGDRSGEDHEDDRGDRDERSEDQGDGPRPAHDPDPDAREDESVPATEDPFDASETVVFDARRSGDRADRLGDADEATQIDVVGESAPTDDGAGRSDEHGAPAADAEDSADSMTVAEDDLARSRSEDATEHTDRAASASEAMSIDLPVDDEHEIRVSSDQEDAVLADSTSGGDPDPDRSIHPRDAALRLRPKDVGRPPIGDAPQRDSVHATRSDHAGASAEGPATPDGWTTAEELFSRPVRAVPPVVQAPAAVPGVPVDDLLVVAAEDSSESVRTDRVAAVAHGRGDAASSVEAEPHQVTEEADRTVPPAGMTADAIIPPRSQRSGDDNDGRPPRRPRSDREPFSREMVGIAVLVVLALVCGGLITAVILKTQRDSAVAAREAANYTPPPLATPKPAPTGPVVAVIGDGTTSTAGSGVTPARRWSALVAKSIGGMVDADASTGMGYTAKGRSGETFVQAAGRIPSNTDVIVFFGGASDSHVSTLSLAKAATDAYSAASGQAPHAKLIVVGPAVTDGVSDTDLIAIRNILRSAAAIAKATWIDPLDRSWLSQSAQSGTATGLTASDEKTLASKMESAVKAALK